MEEVRAIGFSRKSSQSLGAVDAYLGLTRDHEVSFEDSVLVVT